MRHDTDRGDESKVCYSAQHGALDGRPVRFGPSFGLVGLFLGPVIMAAVLTIWREWVMQTNRRMSAGRSA